VKQQKTADPAKPVTAEVNPPPSEKLYVTRKPWELEPYYSRHVAAMTAEGLHAKADIAAELAWRDKELARAMGLVKGATP
jgi:hypothetical protein